MGEQLVQRPRTCAVARPARVFRRASCSERKQLASVSRHECRVLCTASFLGSHSHCRPTKKCHHSCASVRSRNRLPCITVEHIIQFAWIISEDLKTFQQAAKKEGNFLTTSLELRWISSNKNDVNPFLRCPVFVQFVDLNQDQTSWSNDQHSCFVFGKSRVQERKPTALSKVFNSSLHCIQAQAGLVLPYCL